MSLQVTHHAFATAPRSGLARGGGVPARIAERGRVDSRLRSPFASSPSLLRELWLSTLSVMSPVREASHCSRRASSSGQMPHLECAPLSGRRPPEPLSACWQQPGPPRWWLYAAQPTPHAAAALSAAPASRWALWPPGTSSVGRSTQTARPFFLPSPYQQLLHGPVLWPADAAPIRHFSLQIEPRSFSSAASASLTTVSMQTVLPLHRHPLARRP
mmetsp:Transcript_26883/g.58458  ORF Transcript_26883/g.58458 Transcript_26883/m.58458 type:complete len:215 (+) Transcript_26883:1500-2144(+)